MADNRLTRSYWFQGDGMEAPPMVVTDISQTDEAGRPKTIFDFGERMRVSVRYRTRRRIVRPDFSIGVNRADDVYCCSYSTYADNVDLPVLDGEGVIELVTPPLRLVADTYKNYVEVRERGRVVASQLGETFHIRHPVFQAESYGVFQEAGDWRVE